MKRRPALHSPNRHGEHHWQGLSLTGNSYAAQWQSVTNKAVEGATTTTVTGNVFLAQSPEAFLHDLDGNLRSDGRWTNRWDAENRLILMTTPANLPTNAQKALRFTYDYQGRRSSKTVSNWNGSAWTFGLSNKFVWNGWHLVAELEKNNTVLRSYLWGSDLSGTIGGAGGVGGLLAMRVHSGTNTGSYFYSYDGNGNVVALVNATNGAIAAQYEYGPFGELIRATGPLARENPFLFSTKFYDWESELYYYGYRYYNPSMGRWLSRDPAEEEEGGPNLYGFIENAPLNSVDPLGEYLLDPNRRLVVVGRCEIVILYGHGSSSTKSHWNWRVTRSGCAAGAAVMCYPVSNSAGLPENMNLWTEWGGEELEDWTVMWGLSPFGNDWYTGGIGAKMPNANKVIVATANKAGRKVRDLCRDCCCREVKLSFVQISKKGAVVIPPTDKDGLPALQDAVFGCPGQTSR